jgi:hypothetical protein
MQENVNVEIYTIIILLFILYEWKNLPSDITGRTEILNLWEEDAEGDI